MGSIGRPLLVRLRRTFQNSGRPFSTSGDVRPVGGRLVEQAERHVGHIDEGLLLHRTPIAFCAAASGASNQVSRNRSNSGLVDQPNVALSPLPRMKLCADGFNCVTPAE